MSQSWWSLDELSIIYKGVFLSLILELGQVT